MDNSTLGFAWGRLSHRRTRSGDPGNHMAPPPPVEFTRHGTKYTLEAKASPPPPTPPKPTAAAAAQHARSKSWSPSKDKGEAAAKPHIFFQFKDYPNYKAALSPPNPLDLHRAASSSKGSHRSRSNNSISSVSTRNTSLHGSSSSIEIPHKPLPALPPQRPPRPRRGLFEDDESAEEHAAAPVNAGDVPLNHCAEDETTMKGLILQSDQAFADVGAALASVTYNTRVAQARPDMLVVSRSSSVRPRRHHQRFTAPVPPPRQSSVKSNRSVTRRGSVQSCHSTTSTKGLTAAAAAAAATPRQPTTTTKKMGKRDVLLPRKLRRTLSQGVSDLLTSRPSKRVSVASISSSVYSDEQHPLPHKRNSSISAAKRQSSKRVSTDSWFSWYAAQGSNPTASQMYHREMLPNSVIAWMGTDSVFAEPDDMEDSKAEDDELSHDFEDKCNLLATSPATSQPEAAAEVSAAAAAAAAETRPLSIDGSSPPPPPPPKNPARFGPRARTSQLAPIPEMLVVAAASSAEGERRHRRRKSSSSTASKLSPKSKPASGTKTGTRAAAAAAAMRDSLYLVGTTYSKASPLFRHGHIEFHHKKRPARAAGASAQDCLDQQLDWLQFHSPSSVDADADDDDLALDEADDAMADELGEWFDEFGFESHGALIKSGRAPRQALASRIMSRSMDSSRSSASSESTLSDADLPYMPASPSPFTKMQTWSFDKAARSRDDDGDDEHSSDLIPVASELELGLDIYSLPSEEAGMSAKQALRHVRSSPRMSCNLSEDLGQFLAWTPTFLHRQT